MNANTPDVLRSAGAVVSLRALELRIGTRKLLHALDLEIAPGDIWCVLGANGAGKTTFLRAIAGLHPPAAGSVQLSGRDLHAYSGLELAKIRAYMPQSVHDTFSARVLDVVLTARYPHLSPWGWRGDYGHDIAQSALAAVDLAGFDQRDVLTLSGGERQRVSIAMLLAQEADVMLLDEPVAALDLHHQAMVLDHLQIMAAGGRCSVLMSLHDLNLAYRYATHCILLDMDGKAVSGLVEDVMTGDALSHAFDHTVNMRRIDDEVFFVAEHRRPRSAALR